MKTTVSVAGPSASDSDSENDFAYGAGVNFNLNPRTCVGLDYMRHYSTDGVKKTARR